MPPPCGAEPLRGPAIRRGWLPHGGICTLLDMDKKPRPWTALQLDLLGKLSALIVREAESGAAVRWVLQGDVRAALLLDE